MLFTSPLFTDDLKEKIDRKLSLELLMDLGRMISSIMESSSLDLW